MVFADDSHTRRILEPGESLEQAVEGLAKDDLIFDEVMGIGGWAQNRSKADVVPSPCSKAPLRAFIAAADACPSTKVYGSRCIPWARHLGGSSYYNLSAHREIARRSSAMRAGFFSLGQFWTSWTRMWVKRSTFYVSVIEPALSGMTAIAPTSKQMHSLDIVMCRLLRVLEKGRACKWSKDKEEHAVAVANLSLLKKWRMLPLEYELSVRRIGWLQAAIKNPGAHEQFVAAVFGTPMVTGVDWRIRLPALDEAGHISAEAPSKLASAIQSCLMLYEGISGAESFFECWGTSTSRGMHCSWKVSLLMSSACLTLVFLWQHSAPVLKPLMHLGLQRNIPIWS